MADGEESDRGTDLLPPGYWRWHAWKGKKVATREALAEMGTHQPGPREGQAGPTGWRMGR